MNCFLALVAAATIAQGGGLARPPVPIGSPAGWITQDDYPAAAIRQQLEGASSLRLTIDPQGRVAQCVTAISSGSDLLDQTACAIIKMRGHYEPARDGRGLPVAADLPFRMRWVLPKEDDDFPVPIGPFALVLEADISGDGRLSNCTTPKLVGLPVSGELICGVLQQKVPVLQGIAASKMVGHHVTMRISMDLGPIAAPTP